MMQRRDFVRTGAAVTGGLVLGGHAFGVRGLSAGSPLARALARSEAAVDSVLREILLEAVEAAMSAGAGYADARAELLLRQSVRTREDHVQGVSESASEGVGVRAFVDGSWGFAATPDITTDGVVRAARIAAEVAKANAAVERGGVRLAPVEAYGEVTWTAPHEIDPFSVSVEEKANLLLELNQVAMRREGVRCILLEPGTSPGLIATVAGEGPLREAVMDPLGQDIPAGPDHYPALLRGLASAVADCLS